MPKPFLGPEGPNPALKVRPQTLETPSNPELGSWQSLRRRCLGHSAGWLQPEVFGGVKASTPLDPKAAIKGGQGGGRDGRGEGVQCAAHNFQPAGLEV